MKRLFVRHAPARATGICFGHAEVPVVPLCELGAEIEACAETLRRAIGNQRPLVLSSPSQRCCELAECIAALLSRGATRSSSLRLDERLRELCMGEWEGRTWDELQVEDADRLARWMNNWQHAAPPGGETPHELVRRVEQVLDEQPPDTVWVLVTHAGVVRAHWVGTGISDWPTVMQRPVPHLAPIAGVPSAFPGEPKRLFLPIAHPIRNQPTSRTRRW